MSVHELRVCVTAPDYDEALRFYRDVLGLKEVAAFSSEDGHVTILEAGRATLELLDPTHAAFVDAVEVGRRVAGHIRLALEVDDSTEVTRRLEAAGAEVIAEPTHTPWNSLNARLEGPAGLQLTLFTELDSPYGFGFANPAARSSSISVDAPCCHRRGMTPRQGATPCQLDESSSWWRARSPGSPRRR